MYGMMIDLSLDRRKAFFLKRFASSRSAMVVFWSEGNFPEKCIMAWLRFPFRSAFAYFTQLRMFVS